MMKRNLTCFLFSFLSSSIYVQSQSYLSSIVQHLQALNANYWKIEIAAIEIDIIVYFLSLGIFIA